MFNLKDKVAVLFGGSGYLGQEFSKVLLEYGAIVYSCDINELPSELINNLNNNYPSKFHSKKVNALDKHELNLLYKEIIKNDKKIDILINSTTSKGNDFYLPFEEVSLEGWNKGLEGNITIPFLTCQTFIPIMRELKKGSIINISSIYGIVGNDQRIYKGSNLHEVYADKLPDLDQVYSHCVYNAAKGGLNMLTRYLAAYYGQYNVRINTLTPGGIYNKGENEIFLQKYSEKTPLGRKANINEMNGALIFLASDASSYVTGHNLVVDGGFTIW